MKKPPFWATIFTILGILLLCALGTWQIQRLHWKQGVISDIEQALAAEAAALDGKTITQAMENNKAILRGALTGHYRHDHEIAIGPRPQDGEPGHPIVTPFELRDGTIVFVLRGWIGDDNAGNIQRPEGMLTVQGVLKPPPARNPFTPENIPGKNQWYIIDPGQMAASMNFRNYAPAVFYAQEDADGPGWPQPVNALALPAN